MTNSIQEKLIKDAIKIQYPKIDTIPMKITVLADASLIFEPDFIKYNTLYDTVKIDSLVQSKLSDFPAVEPAIKRGVKVKTQFVFPIILKSE